MERTGNLEAMLTCPVCLDIFRDPRQLPCGHSTCMTCLESMVVHSSDTPFRCPVCRGFFGHDFGVQKCHALAAIAEDYRVTRRRTEQQTGQGNQATEASTILRRQLTGDDPHNLCSSNSMTVVVLCLWMVAVYYAYNFSLENQRFTSALAKHQRPVYHPSSKTAGVTDEIQPGTAATSENLMLDLDTASPFLELSPDLHTAERVMNKLPYPRSVSRFDEAPQVLSTVCFSKGTHTWEVEAWGYWDIAVSYKSILRKSKQSAFGKNTESWSLMHDGKGKLFAYHDQDKAVLSETLQSSRIMVTVNFKKGRITFSSLTSTVTQLHEFRAQLTKPVCLGLGLYRVDPPSKASIVRAS